MTHFDKVFTSLAGWTEKTLPLSTDGRKRMRTGFPVLAAELVRINVDIILVTTPQAANAAKKLTKTIPIVVTVIPGPGQQGLWRACSRPGGNVTGLSFMSQSWAADGWSYSKR